MDSEAGAGRGYADLAMIVRPDARLYSVLDLVLEFKYLSLKRLGLEGEAVRRMSEQERLALDPVQLALEEAESQLRRYVEGLRQRYGKSLRLRSYVVVALGLQGLVFRDTTGTV